MKCWLFLSVAGRNWSQYFGRQAQQFIYPHSTLSLPNQHSSPGPSHVHEDENANLAWWAQDHMGSEMLWDAVFLWACLQESEREMHVMHSRHSLPHRAHFGYLPASTFSFYITTINGLSLRKKSPRLASPLSPGPNQQPSPEVSSPPKLPLLGAGSLRRRLDPDRDRGSPLPESVYHVVPWGAVV